MFHEIGDAFGVRLGCIHGAFGMHVGWILDMIAAAGTKATTSALRGHDDAFSSAVAGCAAGSMAGVKRTSARTPIAAPLLSHARWPLAAHRRRRRAPPTQTALDIVPSAAAFSAASWQARRAWPPTAPTTTQR